MAEEFRAAIQALFRAAIEGQQRIADQQQANQWLTAFCATPEAWEACIGLLNNSLPVTVLFFAANALLVKSRGEWSKLDSNQRAQLSATIGDKMLQLVQTGTDALVVKRLCMVLSAMAARSGPEAVGGLAAQAQALAGAAQGPGQLLAALAMLEAVAQESCELDSSRAAANMRGLLPACSAVLALLQQVLLNPQAAGGRPACLAALSCLQAWCGLEGDGHLGGSRPITAPQLAGQLPALYAALFALLAQPDDDVRQSVCGVLVGLLGAAPSDLQGKQGGRWRLAAQEAARQLANLRPLALAPSPGAAACASCLAACCAALCSASAEWASAALPPLDPSTAQAAATAFHANTTITTTAASQAMAGGGSVESSVNQAAAALTSGEADRQAALQVADLVLACLSRPERGVAEACADYLIDLNTVPVAQRAQPLRADVYASALPLLLAHAAYPPDFTGWDSSAEDEDAFNRFREQQLVEVLECCCALMGPAPFLAQLQQRCEEPTTSWQQCEAALCAAQSVSATVKLHVLGRDRGDSGQETRPPDQLAAALAASSWLSALLTPLCTQQARHLDQPWVCRTACRLIGDYAPWFARAHALTACATACTATPQGQQAMPGAPSASPGPSPSPPPEVPLQPALRLLINALQDPVACGTAAPAFRALCGRCAASLVQEGLLLGVMAAALAMTAPPPALPAPSCPPAGPAVPRPVASQEQRAAVVEGLARLVACLPPQDTAQAAMALVQPLVARAQALGDQGTTSHPAALELLAEDLSLLAAALRFLDSPGPALPGTAHPALRVLESAWPMLSAVAQHPVCQGHAQVGAALCEVYQRALLSCKSSAKGLLPTLLASVGQLFQASCHPACCDVLGCVVEVFGEMQSAPELAQLQGQALQGVVAAVAQLLQTGSAPHAQGQGVPLAQAWSAHSDLVRALFSLADRYFVFARDLLLSSPALPQLVSLGVLAAGQREREPVAMALAFLTHLIAVADRLSGEGSATHREQLQRVMAAQGQGLLQVLLVGAADSCPRQLTRPLAGALWALLQSSVFGAAASTWLGEVLRSPAFAAVAQSRLTGQDVDRLGSLLVRRPALSRGRFDALVTDLSALLRGEAGADVLLAYEIC